MMEFWNKLSEALKQKGFSTVQIKKLAESFGTLDATGLLSTPSDRLLAAMTGRTVGEKREKIETLLAVVREIIQEGVAGDAGQGTRRISLDQTRLARLIRDRNAELQGANIDSTRKLRELSRQSADQLRQLGFDNTDQQILRSIADLARVFPPEVAIALLEANVTTLSEILHWSREAFLFAMDRFGVAPDIAGFEYTRLQRLADLARGGANTNTITGLDVDLGSDTFLSNNDRELLREASVETLADWGSIRTEPGMQELSVETVNRLDAYARLYAIGAGGDFAERLMQEGLDSALAIARLSHNAARTTADRLAVSPEEMLALNARARRTSVNTSRLLDTSMAAPDDWLVEIAEPAESEWPASSAESPASDCVECVQEKSAFSRFAYYVYLIQRTGKTADELAPQIIDDQLRTHLLDIFSIDGEMDPVLDYTFIHHLSPVTGAVELADPLASCQTITVLDLFIRRLQEHLDQLLAGAVSFDQRKSLTYLPYDAWRSERLAYYFPELNALWRDDVLTSKDVPEARGSILLNRSQERPVLAQQLESVREALAQASLKQEDNNAHPFLGDLYHQEFSRGLRLIEDILAIDDAVHKAVEHLDDGQPGLTLETLRQAQVSLDDVTERVFPPGSPWRIGDMTSEQFFSTLINVPPSNRKYHLDKAFQILMGDELKLIFEPMATPPLVGFYGNGFIDLEHDAWSYKENTYKQTADGFQIDTSGEQDDQRSLRYNHADGKELKDYRIEFDVEFEDFPVQVPSHVINTVPDLSVFVRRKNTGEGYRISLVGQWLPLENKLPGDELGEQYGHELILEHLIVPEPSRLTPPVRIGTIKSKHVYRLSISVSGSSLQARLVETPTKFVEASASLPTIPEDKFFSEGTFGITVHKNLSVKFSRFQVTRLSTSGPSPFFARNRQIGETGETKMSLDPDMYNGHVVHGYGMSRALMGPPLVHVAKQGTEIKLEGAKRNKTSLYLVFQAGQMMVDTEVLDALLERCLAGLFFLRYAVIPTRMAQALAQSGEYGRAMRMLHLLYDDTVPGDPTERQIYPKFASPPDSLGRSVSPDVQLLRLRLGNLYLEWAEWLFRQDTNESRHQARRLYERVLALHDNADCGCEGQIGTVIESILKRWLVGPGADMPGTGGQIPPPVGDISVLPGTLEGIEEYLKTDRGLDPLINYLNEGNNSTVENVRNFLEKERIAYHKHIDETVRYKELIERGDALLREAEVLALGASYGDPYRRLDPGMRGIGPEPQFLMQQSGMAHSGLGGGMGGGPIQQSEYHEYGEFQYPAFCVPPNPLRSQQIKTACLMLDLLNGCRNILGFAESFVPPVRFEVLLRTARGFADQAHAAERDLFQIRQSFEQYSHSVLEAESNLALSDGDVSLELLNIDLSQGDLRLAEWQSIQTAHSVAHYEALLGAGLSDMEKLALGAAWSATAFSAVAATGGILSAGATAIGLAATATGNPAGLVVAGVGVVGTALGGAQGLAAFSSSLSIAASMQASFERRAQEWEFQVDQGQFGLAIAGENVLQAAKRLEIAHRRRQIATLKREFAADAVQFLSHKFLNRAMWIWLQRTVRDQYRTRLNYAIEVGYMAERALAFELQSKSLRVVRFNYFNPSRDGLLGATQLQTDLSSLEHTRLSLSKRKMQLTRTLSLAQFFPIEFEQFRSGAGRLPFSTAMGSIDPAHPEDAYSLELFDRDFPGHYMRLIKSVKVTVVALIPPHDGIRASLYNSGLSRMVVGPPYRDKFQEVTVSRNPERVALSSPFQASGLFTLDHRDDLLLPFEGLGVATDWIFELPKAANRFDFRTIADILITIEYTALDSPIYREDVIKALDPSISADRPFSFRHQFADDWYDLHHPDLVQDPQQPMAVSFTTRREDFPPNVTDLEIEHVTLYIARKPGTTDDFDLDLKLIPPGNTGNIGGAATTVNGVASTRQVNEGAWTDMKGKSPIGEWSLAFEDKQEVRDLFANDQIEDILFVITFGGETPAWPQ